MLSRVYEVDMETVQSMEDAECGSHASGAAPIDASPSRRPLNMAEMFSPGLCEALMRSSSSSSSSSSSVAVEPEAFARGSSVDTPYGPGVVLDRRVDDDMYKVSIQAWEKRGLYTRVGNVGYLHRGQIRPLPPPSASPCCSSSCWSSSQKGGHSGGGGGGGGGKDGAAAGIGAGTMACCPLSSRTPHDCRVVFHPVKAMFICELSGEPVRRMHSAGSSDDPSRRLSGSRRRRVSAMLEEGDVAAAAEEEGKGSPYGTKQDDGMRRKRRGSDCSSSSSISSGGGGFHS